MKTRFISSLLVMTVTLLAANASHADGKAKKKLQEVNFDGSEVDGEAHNPDGAYLVQKRGVKFVPLYQVPEHFDQSIKESVEYL